MAGLNLYNNGFSAGLIAIVLFPTITTLARHRRPVLQDEDYYDLFAETEPEMVKAPKSNPSNEAS